MVTKIEHQYERSYDALLIDGGAAVIGIQLFDQGKQAIQVEKVEFREGLFQHGQPASIRSAEGSHIEQEFPLVVLVSNPVSQHQITSLIRLMGKHAIKSILGMI